MEFPWNSDIPQNPGGIHWNMEEGKVLNIVHICSPTYSSLSQVIQEKRYRVQKNRGRGVMEGGGARKVYKKSPKRC